MSDFQKFTVGAKLFCDFPFGGKPSAVCLDIITPGNGKTLNGEIRVRVTETIGAYKKGDVLRVRTFAAVPKKMERKLRKGEIFRRVSTLYTWE